MDELAVVILRHVSDAKTNRLWQESYACIRKVYPDIKIVIIDDNSTYTPHTELKISNCEVIQSEFPGRGEILPYYYFHKQHFARNMIFVHDSLFLNTQIPIPETYRFLFDFEHHFDEDNDVLDAMKDFRMAGELAYLYMNKFKWKGCYGSMSIMNWEFLDMIVKKTNFLEESIKIISTRGGRTLFERIIAVLCVFFGQPNQPIFEDIFQWLQRRNLHWGYSYDEYLKNLEENRSYPVTKVWIGR